MTKRFLILTPILVLTGFLASPALAQGPNPQKQVEDFYKLCEQGKANEALEAALSTSETVKEADAKRVAAAFGQMVGTMGDFLDYEIVNEVAVTKRVTVLRCVAHFDKQPFVNEFTFFNPGDGWRIVHLRYDANPATMFQPDIAREVTQQR